VFVCGRGPAARIGLALEGARVCIQGFGNVAMPRRLFSRGGAKVIALQTVEGRCTVRSGIDVLELTAHQQAGRPLAEFSGASGDSTRRSGKSVGVLIPAALEQQISAANAARSARACCSRRQRPATPEADDILAAKASWWCPT